MAIPDFQTLMRPILELHEGGREWERAPLLDTLAERFGLTPEERTEPISSGPQPIFYNRVAWATTHLVKAKLLDRPRRGVTRLTDRGRDVLERFPDRVDARVLDEFEEYQEFRARPSSRTVSTTTEVPSIDTPEETIAAAHEQITNALAGDLLEKVLEVEPSYFEFIVVDLLVKMGYGGTHKDAGQRLGRSGDQGVDGVIREDKLGLDAIYVQAKRWAPDHAVRRPDVQAFVGALQGFRAGKGVFITTSRFTDEAREYVEKVEPRVVLIDGRELTRLMIDHDVGVIRRQEYVLKRIDEDYFVDESL